ncbi:MAG TPA: GNAT family N-acetyltransferase [Chthoniobacter sp.]|nr:GNAT family N-acetyltransferase [Chthoniobacter sp.]
MNAEAIRPAPLKIEAAADTSAAGCHLVRQWLREHNCTTNPKFMELLQQPEHEVQTLVLLASNDTGVVGGLFAETRFAWLRISIIAVRPENRSQGIGAALLAEAERAAAARGCEHAYVETMEYQAPRFYLGHGYRAVGEIPNWDSLGHRKYFLTKNLATAKVRYRVATAEDCPRLAELNRELIRDEGHRNRMTVPELEQRMRDWIAKEYRAVIFEDDSEIVAYVLFREEPQEIYLRQLFVVAHRRGQGIGRRAVEILRTQLWPHNKRLTVAALTSNENALQFWRSLGYTDYAVSLEILPGT